MSPAATNQSKGMGNEGDAKSWLINQSSGKG